MERKYGCKETSKMYKLCLLLEKGVSRKDIVKKLGIKNKTVMTCMNKIRDKGFRFVEVGRTNVFKFKEKGIIDE